MFTITLEIKGVQKCLGIMYALMLHWQLIPMYILWGWPNGMKPTMQGRVMLSILFLCLQVRVLWCWQSSQSVPTGSRSYLRVMVDCSGHCYSSLPSTRYCQFTWNLWSLPWAVVHGTFRILHFVTGLISATFCWINTRTSLPAQPKFGKACVAVLSPRPSIYNMF